MSVDESRVQSIYFAALDRSSSAERELFLVSECGADVDLRRQVERLLSAQKRVGDFLQPVSAASMATVIGSTPDEEVGAVIGPYKLREVLGEGGMGTVYAAEQEHPVRRKVALKVIKPGMDSRDVIARFEAERQALALMDHPHIAKVLDAGTTESGRPYFVMELVRGIPITDYCDQCNLAPRARLALFVQVCRAVQHAHQKGIIHRDLKPSNVMVTLHDGSPMPKVIDFGVAKATNQKLTEHTIYTRVAQMVGTPLYMSPEQAEMSALDVDTRSDVYSLGVLLYELLTGMTPFDKETLSKASYDEMRRIIREDEPPRPSQRVSTLEAQARSTVSGKRGIDERKLTQSLRGELDWIVMKALEKDRQRRYESASAFAADIQRYLDDEPVEACPPSAAYRLRKYARRNRTMLTTGIVVAMALVVGTALSLWQAFEAIKARKLADDRLGLVDEQRQNAAANLQKALDAVDQMLTRVGDEKLRDIPGMEPVHAAVLADALKFYQEFLRTNSSDPTVRHRAALAYHRMAWALGDLPDPDDVGRENRDRNEAFRLIRELHEEFPDNPIYQYDLAVVEMPLIWSDPKVSEREPRCRRAIDMLERLASNPPAELTLEGLLAGSRRHGLAVVPADVNARNPRENVRQVILCVLATEYGVLATSYYSLIGKKDEAEAMLRKAIQIIEGAPGWNQHVIAWCYHELSNVYDEQGRAADAQAAIDRGLAYLRNLLREKSDTLPYRSLFIQANIRGAKLLVKAQRAEEALALSQAAFDVGVRQAEDSPSIKLARDLRSWGLTSMFDVLKPLGRTDEILALADKLPDGDGWAILATLYRDGGEGKKGLEAAQRALEINPNNAGSLVWFGEHHRNRGETVEALDFFDRAIAADPKAIAAWRGRAEVMKSKKDYQAEAESWSKSIELSPGEWHIYKRRATACFRLGRFDEALADIATGVAMKPDDGSNLWWIPPAEVGKCPSEAFRKGMLALADKAIDSTKGALECRLARGMLRAAMGDLAAAEVDHVAAATSSDPSSFLLQANIELVDFYRQTRQREKEEAAATRMVTLGEQMVARLKSTVGLKNRETVNELVRLGRSAESIPILEEALGAAKEVLGLDDSLTLICTVELASVLRGRDQAPEAIALLEDVLRRRRQIFGDKHPETKNCLGHLGIACSDNHQYVKAVPLFREALALSLEIHGADDCETLTLLAFLGDAFTRLGQSDKAIPILKDGFERSRRVLGADHDRTLLIMGNLANAYLGAGEVSKGRELLEKALETRMRVSGADHPETVKLMSGIGAAPFGKKWFAKGFELLERALEAQMRVKGADHNETLVAMNQLGLAYLNAEEFAKARMVLERALEARTRVSGVDHPDTLTLMNNLGHAYMELGEFAKGRELLEKALETRMRLNGADNHETLVTMINLEHAYIRSDEFAKARELLERALEARTRVSGPDHHLTLQVGNDLGFVYGQMKEFAKAQEILEKALEMRTRVSGEDHHETSIVRENLADVYCNTRQWDKAMPLAERQIEIRRRENNEVELATALAVACDMLLAQQKWLEAEPLARECLKIREARLADSWFRFNAMNLLGGALLGQKKCGEAEPLLLQAIAGFKERKSKIPDQVVRHVEATERLVKLYEALDKVELAEKWRMELELLKSSEVKLEVPAVE